MGLDGCEDGEEFDINVLSNSSDNQLDGDSDKTEDEVTSFLNAQQCHKPTVPCVPTKQKQQCRSGMLATPAYDPLNCCKSFHRPSSYIYTVLTFFISLAFDIQCAVRQPDGANAPFVILSTTTLDEICSSVAEKLNCYHGRISLQY